MEQSATDTKAIQSAIDDGGMVYIPKGIYKTGTLYLKSNGGLHLAAGAVLIGSMNEVIIMPMISALKIVFFAASG